MQSSSWIRQILFGPGQILFQGLSCPEHEEGSLPPAESRDQCESIYSIARSWRGLLLCKGDSKIYPVMQNLPPTSSLIREHVRLRQAGENSGAGAWQLAAHLQPAERGRVPPVLPSFHEGRPRPLDERLRPGWKPATWANSRSSRGRQFFSNRAPIGPTYRTFRWERPPGLARRRPDYRSRNTTLPDGPEKTLWGPNRRPWFKKTVDDRTRRSAC